MESALEQIANNLRAFFAWWFGELAAVVPSRVRRAVRRTSQTLVLEFAEEEIIVGYEAEGDYRELGRIDASFHEHARGRGAMTKLTRKIGRGRTNAIIRLPQNKVLQKSIRLPVATEENLREVLGFEMDRHTPFKSGEVFYDYRITERDDEAQQIEVELAVAPRAVVDSAIGETREFGLNPVSVEIAGDDTTRDDVFNFLPLEQDDGKGRHGGRLTIVLGLLVLVLGALAVYVPIDRERSEAVHLLDRVAAAKAEAELAARLRDEINETIKAGGFLVDKKRQAPAVIELLAELTRLFPDDTWLLQFQLRGPNIIVAGYSARASDLVGVIEQSPYFQDAKFRSIVAQDVNVGLERFQLSATLERESAQ